MFRLGLSFCRFQCRGPVVVMLGVWLDLGRLKGSFIIKVITGNDIGRVRHQNSTHLIH